MDTDLQKELLAILRELKNGAPDAWRVLVEQRSTYCFTVALGMVIFSSVLGLIGWRLITEGSKRDAAETNVSSQGGLGSGMMFIGAVTILVSFVCAGVSISWWAAYAAPLGQLLGKVV